MINYKQFRKLFFKRHFCMFTTSYEEHLNKAEQRLQELEKEIFSPSWKPNILDKTHIVPRYVNQVRLGKTMPLVDIMQVEGRVRRGSNLPPVAVEVDVDKSAFNTHYLDAIIIDEAIVDDYNNREEEHFAMKQYEEEFVNEN